MLTRAGCETRQARFRSMLAGQGLDAAVVTDAHEILYLTGFPIPDFPLAVYLPAVFYLETEGRSRLIAHTADEDALADEWATYEWNMLGTANPDRTRRLVAATVSALSGATHPRRLGWPVDSLPRLLGERLAEILAPDEWVPIDDQLAALEKYKEPDEVTCIREAIACDLAGYDAAAQSIGPGVNELAVLEAAHAAATRRAGRVIYHGGDYASGAMGGPARNRFAASGELYIVDAQSRYDGYWSDLSRTYPVGEATALQREVYNHVAEILAGVPEMIDVGSSGTDLWRRLDIRIREHPHLREVGLMHHGGHGVGVRPHEAPDINRDRDSVFEVGDIFSCEPGAYSPALNFGLRLENMFRMTDAGVELLSEYPVLTL
ncbi:MAG TPA: M24 family metallopeptidase [Chloroflexota bacterium]